MAGYRHLRSALAVGSRWCAIAAMNFAALLVLHAQTPRPADSGAKSITLDRVIAVVNRQAILESDLEDEMQISILDPTRDLKEKETPQQALDRLISRTLIQQQIRDENASVVPAANEVTARVEEMRKELPACLRAHCESDAGWKTFLGQHDLTPSGVENYIRNRMEILSFIEARFRQGIRITPEEIETYYRETLLPQYPQGQAAPSVQQISSRIEEILLQQRVNELFGTWLTNLRKQGQIEILDPALETSDADTKEASTKE
jgi:peptidyl-prolyl cis-trans isomerase SurA